VTLPEPELDVGADGALDRPLPDVVLPEPPPVFDVLELPVLELPVLELPLLELPVPPDEPVPDEPLLELLEAAPGRAKATAPAATALITPAVNVTARSRA